MATELNNRTFWLESLAERTKAITEEAVGFYKENCMVCFHHNDHKSGVILAVTYNDSVINFEIFWDGEVTDQMLQAYTDTRRATDMAACAIALVLISELTEFIAVEQSAIGTTIDYYLTTQPVADDLIFNRTARLEVSGILTENEGNTVDGRIREKTNRLVSEGDLRDFIAVVEFSKPWSKMVEHE